MLRLCQVRISYPLLEVGDRNNLNNNSLNVITPQSFIVLLYDSFSLYKVYVNNTVFNPSDFVLL